MIRNPYQEELAEMSLSMDSAEEGEYWKFRWYIDPMTNGLAKWHQFYAHVSPDGDVSMIGMWIATTDEERTAQLQAVQFAKDRYERYGLDETHSTPDQTNRN